MPHFEKERAKIASALKKAGPKASARIKAKGAKAYKKHYPKASSTEARKKMAAIRAGGY